MALALALVWIVASLNAEFDPTPWWLDLLVGFALAIVTGVVAVRLLDREA